MTLAEAAESGDFTCEGYKPPKETSEGAGGSATKMTLSLVLIGLVGSLFIVGVVYARRHKLGQSFYFGGGGATGNGWPSANANGNNGGGPTLGYANLPRRGAANAAHSDEE